MTRCYLLTILSFLVFATETRYQEDKQSYIEGLNNICGEADENSCGKNKYYSCVWDGNCVVNEGRAMSVIDSENPLEELQLSIPKVNDYDLEAMYATFMVMDEFMKKYNVNYFLAGGTLIGAMRNNPPGPILWDDDMDVNIFEEDEGHKVYAMMKDPEFKKRVVFRHMFFGYTFIHRDYYKKTGKEYLYDIFFYRKIIKNSAFNRFICNKKVREYAYHLWDWARWYWPNDGFKYKPELVDCVFWGQTVKCPEKSAELLKGWYSNGVLETAKVVNHKGVAWPNIIDLRSWPELTESPEIPKKFQA